MRPNSPRGRGFTLVELGAVVALGAAGAAVGAATLNPPKAPANLTDALIKARASDRQLKDATQIRGIMQAMVIWSQNNKDMFPLPSRLDTKDETVATQGRAKDTTANILSIMIFNGMISPDLTVSPAEAAANIQIMQNYSYTNPAAAAKPAGALWDPAFSADFSNGKAAHNSYAMIQPSDARLPRWSSTFNSTEPVVGNRAPKIESVTAPAPGDALQEYTVSVKPGSLTNKIHGPAETWEGNMAFADAHCDYITSLAPRATLSNVPWPTYSRADDAKRLDTFFFDETDDAAANNAFLGVFTTAGKDAKDFNAIWD